MSENRNVSKEFNLLDLLFYVIDLIKKYKKLITVCFLVALVLTAILSALQKPRFEKKFILTSSVVSSERINNILMETRDAVEDRELPIIESALKLTEAEAKTLKKVTVVISPNDIANMVGREKTIMFREMTTEITVVTTDSIIAAKLPVHFSALVNGNEFIKKEINQKLTTLAVKKGFIMKEAGYIDTLKKMVIIHKDLAKSKDILALSEVMVEIGGQLAAIEDQLANLKEAVTIIKEDTVLGISLSKRIAQNLGLMLVLAFVVIFITILLKELSILYNAQKQ